MPVGLLPPEMVAVSVMVPPTAGAGDAVVASPGVTLIGVEGAVVLVELDVVVGRVVDVELVEDVEDVDDELVLEVDVLDVDVLDVDVLDVEVLLVELVELVELVDPPLTV